MPATAARRTFGRTLAVLSFVTFPLTGGAQEPAGGEFQVNTFTTGPQAHASVARHADGTFMVVWDGLGQSSDSLFGVFGRIYDADGDPVTGEFHVNTYTTQRQTLPRVAAAPASVVVWESYLQDGFQEGVFGQCFDASGNAGGSEFRVNSRVLQAQYLPDVAMSASGSFAVVWMEIPVDRTYAQLYAPNCTRVGGDFQVFDSLFPKVGMDAAGNFVVTGLTPDDGDIYGVTARLFSAGGTAKGAAFLVNTVTTGWQDYPSVAMEPGGDFVVAWNEYVYPSTPGVADDVWVRAYRASGAPVGPGLVVNTYTTYGQQGTAVATDAAGNFVVVWNGPSDGSTSTVLGQRFLAPDLIFADGFNAGNLSGWSTAATDAGDLSADPAAAMASTAAGLRAVIDDTAGIYIQDDSPSDEERYRARFYFDPNGFDPGVAQAHLRTRVFIGFEEAPNRRLFAVVLRLQGTQYSLMGRARRDDNVQTDTGFFPITDGPHYVEIDWRRSTGPDALDGTFEMWIDGVSVSTLTGLDNSISAVDFARMGALSVKGGASGALWWDEFESRRRTEIGGLP